jgi:hypothetical protein
MVCNLMVGINMAVFSKNRQITPGMKSPGKVIYSMSCKFEEHKRVADGLACTPLPLYSMSWT